MPIFATHRLPAFLLVVPLLACSARRAPPAGDDSRYLYLWTAAPDSTSPDFLAVVDVRPDSAGYGALIATLPVTGAGNHPHHTEHSMPADGQLFANGFATGQTFIFDLTDGAHPRLAGQFGEQAGFSHPHSFLRLPGGNVLSTFQMKHVASGMAPGGLVEMTPAGRMVRSSSAMGPGAPPGLRPYSGAIVPALDRIVTTTTDMDEKNPYRANQLQIWRLSDLSLLHTISLPPGPLGDEADFTAEPRLLADGRTVMVSTFNCALYLLDGLAGDHPSGRLVATFPRKQDTSCAIPVVAGHFWIVTVPAIPAVVSLDLTDPGHPREVSRLTLESADIPHWISLEPNTRRLVITGYGALEHRALIATFDSATGALAPDHRFRTIVVAGTPHGAVFSRPAAPRDSSSPD